MFKTWLLSKTGRKWILVGLINSNILRILNIVEKYDEVNKMISVHKRYVNVFNRVIIADWFS